LQDHYAWFVALELLGRFLGAVMVDAAYWQAVALFDAVLDPFFAGHSVNAFQNAMMSAVM
jgi:hypothetical protein